MNVNLPKTLNKVEKISTDDMEVGKVYQFAHLLASSMPSGCIIAVDSNDSDVITFDNHYDLETYLDDNSFGNKGELTPYQMFLSIK